MNLKVRQRPRFRDTVLHVKDTSELEPVLEDENVSDRTGEDT